MNQIIPSYQQYLRQSGRSERTAKAYLSDAAHYIAFCEREYGGETFSPSMFNRADLVDYQTRCRKKDRQAAATWNRRVASLAVFGQWLRETNAITANPVEVLTRAETQKLAPRSLSTPDFKRLRRAVIQAVLDAKTPAAARQARRNAAIICLMAEAGLREGEVVRLRVPDVLLGERKGRIFICDAKGNKDRSVPLDKESVDTIKAWLAVRPQTGAETLFIGRHGDPLLESGIGKLVTALCLDAHIEPITPHQLRHTFAHRLLERGATLPQIAELLGHASIEITRRYTLPHWQELEEIVEAL